ncbi:MAG: OmpH family outer membrane protein, partial [Planctomycetota bacterium]
MPKAGAVSIRRIFRDCKRSAKYRQESNAERQNIDIELTGLGNEIKAQQAGLKTLKTGSESYLAQVKEILEKQGSLKALQEFYKQQLALTEQRVTEDIYGDLLRITGEVAKEKGLVWVFENSEPMLPATSPTELELSMGMHKLLYGDGCQDITDEVM